MKKILCTILVAFLCLNLNSCTIHAQENENLMIVAHPDDETIWGGAHLIDGNYTVLCITNGNNKERKTEFKKAIKLTHSKGIILSYPDKTNGKRDNWNSSKKKITKEIKKVIQSKNWNLIVTHNPDGEYGHIHHKMISQIVTKIVKKDKETNKLVYFGKYTSRKNKANLKNEKTIKSSMYKKKLKICNVYSSQKKVMKHLHHMLKHENWIPYKNWDKISEGD